MEIAALTYDSPFMKFVFAFMISATLGIVWVVVSKDRRSKRIVLPLTLAAFSIGVFLIVVGSGQYDGQPLVTGVIALALLANALFVNWRVQFCEECGTTIQRTGKAPWRCEDCNQRARRAGTL